MNTLDPFEATLLAELRSVAQQAPHRARRPSKKLLTAAAAAACGAGVIGAGLLAAGTTPAYAVSTSSNGDVVVTISRLADASGLKQALAEQGINAAVTYQGTDLGKALDPSTFPTGDRTYTVRECMSTVGPTIAQDGDGFRITIPAQDIGTGENLAIFTAGSSAQDADMLLGYGNRSSGCSTMTEDGHDGGWVVWY